MNEIIRNLRKDLTVEFRSRFALNIAISFAGIITLAISLVIGGVPLAPKIQAIFLWVIFFFAAMNGLSHIFVREVDQGTGLFLTLNTGPGGIFISKLIFNILFFFIIQAVVTPLFIFFLQVDVRDVLILCAVLVSGGLAVASATTFLAAMVAKAGGKGSLFTIISFPILLPVLWVSIITTAGSFEIVSTPDNHKNIIFLLAFSGAVIAVSYILFPFVWQEE